MYKLKDLVLNTSKPVYVHLKDEKTAKGFLSDAENQGFIFSDGTKPTEKHSSDFFALRSDLTVNYIGAVGRMAYQCKANDIICVEYGLRD